MGYPRFSYGITLKHTYTTNGKNMWKFASEKCLQLQIIKKSDVGTFHLQPKSYLGTFIELLSCLICSFDHEF